MPSPRREPSSSPWSDRYIQAALAAAVASRLLFVAVDFKSVVVPRRYITPALDLLHGRFFSNEVIDQLPGAPLFYALCILIFGENFSAAALAQHALGLASFCLLVLAAWRSWGPRAGRWTAAVLALQLIVPYQERLMLSEAVAEFFFAAALFLTLEVRREAPAGLSRYFLAGLAAGMAALSRGELILVGPLAALFLAAVLKGRFRRGAAALFAGWLLLIGGWRIHNGIGGFAGFNAHGPTCLLDGPGADLLVRHDLPSNALAKRLLLEEDGKCAGVPGCSGRLHVYERLQNEFGYTYLQSMQAVGEMAREAVFTQPLKFLPVFIVNFRLYLTPYAWVSEDRDERPDSPLRDHEGLSESNRRFWRALESGPQYFGWAAFLLAYLAPLCFWLKPRSDRLAAAFLWGVVLAVISTASFFRGVPRTQAQLYLPLALLAGYAADALSAGALKKGSRTP